MNEVKVKTKTIEAEPKSAVQVVDHVLRQAVMQNASDIHLDPRSHGTAVRIRIDGELENFGTLPKYLHEEIIARLKILSGTRTDIHAIPQDGRLEMVIGETKYNVRISFMPTYRGENAVLRLLPSTMRNQDTFAALGFIPEHVDILSRALAAPNGLILATGPTGCGKTTTLRVCLGLKALQPLSVMTLEDPIEYEIPAVRHVHIRDTFGVTFASGLRSALRQDPDVIMVGEIRDNETARTAVQTALTGHLVLSTLHTTSALDTILRLSDMAVERYLIAATLRLIINQRLVRTICHECGGEDCKTCRGTGFHGRSVIAEVLEVDEKLRDLISKGESTSAIREHIQSKGFRSIHEDAREKTEWGVTTKEEVMKALST